MRDGVDGVVRDWSSAEILKRKDGIYDFAIAVGHNRFAVEPGHGSAIFVHSWYGPGVATIGCTAMPKAEVKAILKWLDAKRGPVLVQLPREELKQVELPPGLVEAIEALR